MPLRYDTEEELKSQRASAAVGRAVGNDTEIALGTRSLLAIFFGLVLICAVFFGLGYSVGRGSGARAAAQASPDVTNPMADSHLSKPSADQGLTPVEAPATSDGSPTSDNSPATHPSSTAALPAASTPVPSSSIPASTPTAQNPAKTAATAPAATLQPASATTASFMVQVAAVRVPQDAQILVDALKKHGYTAVVRNEPQDQLLHVQLGPFAARADATAMRTKLLGDGYNAVVK